MGKYKRKPIVRILSTVIEAFQMTKERRLSNLDWPEWLNKAWNEEYPSEGAVWPEDYPNSDGTDRLCVGTLEGIQVISWNDYIILGIKGELYACKPDVFEIIYEEVAENGALRNTT